VSCASSAWPDDKKSTCNSGKNPTRQPRPARSYPAQPEVSRLAIAQPRSITPRTAEPKLTLRRRSSPAGRSLNRRVTEYPRGILAADQLRQPRRGPVRRVRSGPAARAQWSWTCRRCASFRGRRPGTPEALLQAARETRPTIRHPRLRPQVVYIKKPPMLSTRPAGDVSTTRPLFPARRRNRFRFFGGDEKPTGKLGAAASPGQLGPIDQGLGQALHRPSAQQQSPCRARKSRDLLRELIWTPPSQPPFGRPELVPVRESPGNRRAAGAGPLKSVSRTGYAASSILAVVSTQRRTALVWTPCGRAGVPPLRPDHPLRLDALRNTCC